MPSKHTPYYLFNTAADSFTGPFSSEVDAMLARNLATIPSQWTVITPEELKVSLARSRADA